MGAFRTLLRLYKLLRIDRGLFVDVTSRTVPMRFEFHLDPQATHYRSREGQQMGLPTALGIEEVAKRYVERDCLPQISPSIPAAASCN